MATTPPTLVPGSTPPAGDPDPRRAPDTTTLGRLGPTERIALLAFTMSLTALGIDLLLPAFPEIRASLGLAADSNATAGLITTYFLGLAVGQIGFGVLADGRGRRPTLYLGFAIYGLGALASVLAPTLPALLATRFVWGLGAAAGRVVTLAVVRDTWSGDRMSRAMSFVMAVFILVPVVSPALGASLLTVVGWRWLLGACAVAAAAVAVWALRLPETLRPEDRRSMRPRRVVEAARMAVQQPATLAGGLGMMLLFGAFTSWIGSAELIVEDVFGLGALFPVIFGGLASVLGAGMLLNARIVGRFGTHRVTRVTLVGYLVVAVLFAGVAVASGGVPPFPLFAAGLGLLLGAHALLAPNVNAIAMEPVGHIAGTASALIGTVQVAGGAALGAVIDRLYDGSVTPLAVGFLVYGIAGAVVISWGLRHAEQPDTTGPSPVPVEREQPVTGRA